MTKTRFVLKIFFSTFSFFFLLSPFQFSFHWHSYNQKKNNLSALISIFKLPGDIHFILFYGKLISVWLLKLTYKLISKSLMGFKSWNILCEKMILFFFLIYTKPPKSNEISLPTPIEWGRKFFFVINQIVMCEIDLCLATKKKKSRRDSC